MTVEYIDLKESLTVAQAIERIRRKGLDSETINICYVLDHERKLLGTAALRYLLLSRPDQTIGDIMHENVIAIHTLMDQEEVAAQFKKYDFTAMPVVDNENRMVGIITVDDIVDIIDEETTEDIEKMAAIMPSDKPYMYTGIFETYKKRIPWLLLLMVSATFTGQVIKSFEDALSVCTVLTLFIPMLMDTGGNSGSQASTMIIRGMAVGEVEPADILKVMWKEIRVGMLCGLSLALVNFVRLMIQYPGQVLICLTVVISLFCTVIIAKTIGCVLPIAAKTIHLDPAIMASPMITTIVDACSLMIYFQLACHLLNMKA